MNSLIERVKYWIQHPLLFWDKLVAALLKPIRAYLQNRKVRKSDIDPSISFFVVSCGRNAGQSTVKCLQSVYDQQIAKDKVQHLLIDDASEDETARLVCEWLDGHPDHSVKFVQNETRKGGTLNTLEAFRQAPKGSIVLEVNSDDWLPDPMVFDYLGRIYSDKEVWMTYNSYQFSGNEKSPRARPYPTHVVRKNSYRDYEWICLHLHSFRSSLLSYLSDDVFIDPETGDYFSCADDRSIYWSLLELCGRHAISLYRVAYVYNFHDFTETNLHKSDSIRNAETIRKMPRQSRLERL